MLRVGHLPQLLELGVEFYDFFPRGLGIAMALLFLFLEHQLNLEYVRLGDLEVLRLRGDHLLVTLNLGRQLFHLSEETIEDPFRLEDTRGTHFGGSPIRNQEVIKGTTSP